MNGGYLLDTNILIAMLGADQNVHEKINAATHVYVPIVAIAELYYGALGSRDTTSNLQKITRVVSTAEVLGCDLNTALEYGSLKHALRLAGTPIPENDIWIAAVARQHGLILVSRDAHFAKVEGITVESW